MPTVEVLLEVLRVDLDGTRVECEHLSDDLWVPIGCDFEALSLAINSIDIFTIQLQNLLV